MAIYSIRDLRELAPDELKDAPDSVLINEYAKDAKLDPLEVANYFGYNNNKGMASNRIAAGVDNYQANMYGLGGAVSRKLGAEGTANWFDRRREANELDANTAMLRARRLGAVDDWREVDGIGSGLNYLGGLGAQSLPYLGEAAVGAATGGLSLTGTAARFGLGRATARTAGAVAASYPSAVGDILSNQREAGGEDLGSAAVGGIPYAALNALGVEGAVARGFRPLAVGQGGMMRRMATGGVVTGFGEGVGETGQELVNQYFGRMAVDPNETLFNEKANKRYLDSFVGGMALGGAFGTVGGVRRARTEEGGTDLLNESNTPNGQFSPLAPAVNTDLEVGLGITQPVNPYNVGGYVSQFEQGGDTSIGSGQRGLFGDVVDAQDLLATQSSPATTAQLDPQVTARWNELTEKLSKKSGLTAAEIEELGELTRVIRGQQTAPANTQATPAAPAAPALLTDSDRFYAETLGIAIPQGKVRRTALDNLYNAAVASGVPLDSPALEPYWTQIASGSFYGKNQQEKLRVLLQNAIVENRRAQQGGANVSGNGVAAGAAAGSGGQPSAVSNGSVGAGGPNPAVRVQRAGAAGNTGAANGQAVSVAGGSTQPAAAVSADPFQTNLDADEQNRLEIARMTGQAGLADAIEGEAEGTRRDDPTAGDEATIAAEVDKVLEARFGTTPEGKRQAQIAKAYLTAMRSAPQGSKVAVQEAIGQQFGVKPVTVRKYGNTTELVAAAKKLGYTDAQARNLLEVNDNTKAKAGEAVTEGQEKLNIAGTLQGQGIDTQEGEDVGFGVDDSNTWKLANAKDGAGDVANAADESLANAIQSHLQAIDDFERSVEELEAQGLGEAADKVRGLIEKEQKKLENAMKKYKTHLEAKQGKRKAAATPAKATKAAKTEPIVAPETYMTPTEQAQAAWDAVAEKSPTVPSWDTLSPEDQETFVEFGPDNWTKDDVISMVQKSDTMQFGKGAKAKKPYTAKALLAELKNFMRADIPGRKLMVVDTIDDLLNHPDENVRAVGAAIALEGAYGVAADGRAYLVADRIEQGSGRAKFLHEVGAHLGLDNLLSEAQYDSLIKQLKAWARQDNGSLESRLARKAAGRVIDANTPTEDQNAELLAYFIEEAVNAGVDPTANIKSSALRQWFKIVFDAFKSALAKLGVRPETLNSRDIVDLAFGAAKLTFELDTPTTGGMKFGKPNQSTIQRNIAQLPKPLQGPVRTSVNILGDATDKGLDYVVFTHDLIERAVKAGMKSAKTFENLLTQRGTKVRELEREVERIADMYALVPEADRVTTDNKLSVNDFLMESTRTGKWGYGQFADREMVNYFNQLSATSQDFIKAVFAHGDKVLAQKKKAVMDHTTTEYDARIAAETDPAVKAELEKDKANSLKRFESLFKLREGKPYAPIKRSGNYVVIAKSADYLKAEAEDDKATMAKLEKDEDHYSVSFTDTKNQARDLAERLATSGLYENSGQGVYFRERDKHVDAMYGGDGVLKSLAKLRNRIEGANDPTSAKMLRMVSDLYLEALAEGSARKSEMRRRGIAGEVDMLASFAQQGRADANFIASVQFTEPIQESLRAMSKEVQKARDDGRASELRNELVARYLQSLDTEETPWVNRLTRLSSIWYLATSPGYYIQNLTQPWMMSVPAMAGENDYTKASGELFKAYTELKGVMASAKLLKQNFDLTKVPGDVRDAIKELADRNRIDIGMESEMGSFQVEGKGAVRDRWNKIDRGLRLAVQKVETINRLSTAMAAYRLEFAKSKDQQKAIDYADRILKETHGDYSSFNAPRAFNTKLGKVALQFRKFQLIQLSFYAKLVRDAFTNPDERKVALRTLAFSLAHTAALAGVRGLPGYAAIAWILGKLFGDDDEPYDLTLEMRKTIGDKDLANLIMNGAPTLGGVDLSGKIGAGNMLSILPFSNADLSTSQGRNQAAGELLLGASGGMATRFLDGAGMMLSGDYYKGLEQMLPKGFADALKAYREATGGMTRRNGDVILPAEDISELQTFWTALGLTGIDKSVTYERRQRALAMDENFQDRATTLKNQYAAAFKARDTEAMREAREAWLELQAARARNGYTRQPLSKLLKAPQEQRKRERDTIGGVQTNRNNAGFARMQSEL